VENLIITHFHRHFACFNQIQMLLIGKIEGIFKEIFVSELDRKFIASLDITPAALGRILGKSRQTVAQGIKRDADYIKKRDVHVILAYSKELDPTLYSQLCKQIPQIYPEWESEFKSLKSLYAGNETRKLIQNASNQILKKYGFSEQQIEDCSDPETRKIAAEFIDTWLEMAAKNPDLIPALGRVIAEGNGLETKLAILGLGQ